MLNWLIQNGFSTILGAAITALGFVVKAVWARQKKQTDEQDEKQQTQKEEQDAMKAGMLALLHDRIFSIYDYCKCKECATVEDIRNLDYLYKPYHELGGNGTGTELYERIKDMPDIPAEQEAI